MKYIKFNDTVVDASMAISLRNMARLLSGNEEVQFEFGFGHQIKLQGPSISASHFWDHYSEQDRNAGYKSDIVLRALGTYQYSNLRVLDFFGSLAKKMKARNFATALFTFLEDIRLEEICKKKKPGTAKWFNVRRKLLLSYYHSQSDANYTRGFPVDLFFCMIVITLLSDEGAVAFKVDVPLELEEALEQIKPDLFKVYELSSTAEVAGLMEGLLYRITALFSEDMLNPYLVMPVEDDREYKLELSHTFADLKRKDRLRNDDREEEPADDADTLDEAFSTWHREQKSEQKKQTFLRFELEKGVNTAILGNGAREGSDADQAMASVQGSSRQSKQKDYEDLEALDEQKTASEAENKVYPYGERNQYAVHILKKPHQATAEETENYHELKKSIQQEKRALEKTLQKNMEHKQNNRRSDLLYGRLSRKLVPIVTDPLPRVFQKKNAIAKEQDVVFTLLVDCSASMFDKMEETRRAVALFHEVLKDLQIRHSIVGFWEDANEVRKEYFPNIYHEITSFDHCLHNGSGAAIMQLEHQEDNRDGFSIRKAAEQLKTRSEKHKFLLVFSDGEPSAEDYEQNGIVDTYTAVKEARKNGIHVMGMFLSDGDVQDSEENMMKNIYEKEYMIIPQMEELPYLFSQLLKKILLKSM
ncbi:nitric oxide reductase activation protein NorD [Bacillus testis]|uniref:nitric oxide reductase activation protein NorD n=1 Tax=Bacillus testis TaxID=1622072 RepID=UPI00067F480E|nr:VWA domain-containing protein [Bacillus testis]